MKIVSSTSTFTPVTIMLETQQEVDAVAALLRNVNLCAVMEIERTDILTPYTLMETHNRLDNRIIDMIGI
jgi:hypothetical protein